MPDEPTSPAPGDTGISPLSSGGIRRGLLLILGFFTVSWGLYQKLKHDPKSVTSIDVELVVTNFGLALSAGLSLYVGIRNILKRIEVGKDPTNPAPKIEAPAIVQRLTK